VKKIGMIVLALVITLGTIGVGYAMWTDEVVIEGKVYTGSLDLDVDYYSGSVIYKNLDEDLDTPIINYYYVRAAGDPYGPIVHEIYNPHGPDGWHDPPADASNMSYVAQAWAQPVYQGGVIVEDLVRMYFWNIFPTRYQGGASGIYADVIAHYTGSIPAHVGWSVNFTDASGVVDTKLKWLYDMGYMDIYVFPTDVYPDTDRGEPYIQYDVNPAFLEGEVIQVHNCDEIKINVYIDLPQCDDQRMLDAGYICEDFMSLGTEAEPLTFVIKIIAEQWNESQWQ
jgi:hypothetical protein